MHAVLLALLAFGGVSVDQHFTFTAAGTSAVHAETANGTIRVTTGGTRVVATATKKADSQSDLSAIGVSSRDDDGVVSLRATFPTQCNGCSVSFTITVPKGVKLDLSSTNGSVSADGISGSATIASTNGSVSATYASVAQAHTIELKSLNGSVSLALPANAKLGHVDAGTKLGSVSTNWGLPVNRGMVGAGIDTVVSPGGIDVNLSTMNGSISLTKS